MDEEVQNFMSITGGTAQEARQYLEITDGDCNLAVEMYLEAGGSAQSYVSPSDFSREPPRQNFEDEVRAPIPQRQDRIIDPGFSAPGIFTQARQRPQIPKSAFDFADILPDDPEGIQKNRLAELFKPPVDIIYQNSFQQAQEEGAREKKFVMVNMMDISDFQSQAQNRDLWRDKMVKEIVKENFLFLQFSATSDEGMRYASLYKFPNYPHIGVIDPITGERIASWNRTISPSDFSTLVTELLDKYSFDAPPRPTPSKKRTVLEMSEEEQLEAAIRESIRPPEPSPSLGAPSSSTSSSSAPAPFGAPKAPGPASAGSGEPVASGKAQAEPQSMETVEEINAVEHQEPPMDALDVARIQVRLPDGSRVVLRFLKSDKVRSIFEHLKATQPSLQKPEAANFELWYLSNKMREKLDQSIGEAGIASSSLNVSI